MHGHLVTIKVSVKGRTNQRMQLDSLTFDQNRFKRLDAQTVQSRRTVQHHRVFTYHFIQNIPNFRTFFFHQFLSLLHSGRQAFGLQPAVNERLEQLERHLLGQATLMQFQLRARHNHRTTREVDAFAQKVLTEAALLAFQHVRQRFQWTFVLSSDHPATTAIVKQCIDRFLQHTLFVAHDDIWRTQFDKTLQTIITVDHPTIKIVQVRRCKATTIQGHQGTQFWWNHRDHGQDHPFWTVARFDKTFNNLQTFYDFFRLQFTCRFGEINTQLLSFTLKINQRQHFADRFSADVGSEGIHAVNVLRIEEFLLVHQLAIGQVSQARLDDDVVFKVQNPLKITQSHIQHQADTRWQ